MDANQMGYEFDVLYDKIASEASPGYTNREKGVFLTKAELVYFDRYKSAENDEDKRIALSNIKESVEFTAPSNNQGVGKPFGTRYNLPANFSYFLSEEVAVGSDNECRDGLRVRVVPKREDEYSIQVHNPLKRPQVIGSPGDLAWRMLYGNDNTTKRVDLITDGTFTIESYFLTYYKEPEGIVPVTAGDTSTTTQIDSLLDESCHEEIVEIAVRIASGITTPQEYQVKLNEEKINN